MTPYYQDSAVTLLHGDCLDLMHGIPDGSVDMVLCDLPYGTTACAWDTVIPFAPLWTHYRRVCKPNAAIVLTACQPFSSALVMSNPKAFKYEWIWKKSRYTGFLTAKFMPMLAHESVLVFCTKGKPTFNPQKTHGHKPTQAARGKGKGQAYGAEGFRNYRGGDTTRNPITVQTFKSERGLHPTQKPVALFEYLIRTYTDRGQTVLDNCSGAGTTAVSAKHSGRRAILIEREQKYCAVTVSRLAQEVLAL